LAKKKVLTVKVEYFSEIKVQKVRVNEMAPKRVTKSKSSQKALNST
jgi:hypothetical protein